MGEIRLKIKRYGGFEGQCRANNAKVWAWNEVAYPGHLCFTSLYLHVQTNKWYFNQDPMVQKSIQNIFSPFKFYYLQLTSFPSGFEEFIPRMARSINPISSFSHLVSRGHTLHRNSVAYKWVL